MGVRFGTAQTTTQVSGLPANTTETIIFITPVLTMPRDGVQVFLEWSLNILVGTGTSSWYVMIHRGPLISSPFVFGFSWNLNVTAGSYYTFGGCDIDVIAGGGSQYSLSVIQEGAPTVASTVWDGSLLAYVL